jgi:aryl-alcohol dehydrogenase-like predicted oxidoreductase
MTERALWNGRSIPALGLGCWAIGGPFYAGPTALGWGEVDDRESLAALRRGLDLGMRFVDTANVYGAGHSEELVGRAVGNDPEVLVCTKFGGHVDPVTRQAGQADNSPAGIRSAVESSLRRLRRDRIDLCLLHVNSLPIEEAAGVFDTLDGLRRQGKIDAYGWSTDFPERAAAHADRRGFVAVEHAMNVFFAATKMLEVIERKGLLSVNKSPLAMGLLTGKFRGGASVPRDDIRAGNHDWLDYFKDGRVSPAYAQRLEAVRELLRTGGRTLAQGALCWLWARSARTLPIPGFRTVGQVEENAGALEKGPLPPRVMEEIDKAIAREPEGEPRER